MIIVCLCTDKSVHPTAHAQNHIVANVTACIKEADSTLNDEHSAVYVNEDL